MTLTKEQILKMRWNELGAAAAVHVMGWKRYMGKNGRRDWCLPDEKIECVGTVICMENDWKPHTDPRDAFKICYKMFNLGYLSVIHRQEDGSWRVSFCRIGGGHSFIAGAYGPVLASVICRAALYTLAKEADEKNQVSQ